MYALVVHVNIAVGQFENARADLQAHLVPHIKKAPGFVKGYWMVTPEKTDGLSVVVFQGQTDAENAANMVRNGPMERGVSLVSVEMREVVADA